jgi:hypothetical protein
MLRRKQSKNSLKYISKAATKRIMSIILNTVRPIRRERRGLGGYPRQAPTKADAEILLNAQAELRQNLVVHLMLWAGLSFSILHWYLGIVGPPTNISTLLHIRPPLPTLLITLPTHHATPHSHHHSTKSPQCSPSFLSVLWMVSLDHLTPEESEGSKED